MPARSKPATPAARLRAARERAGLSTRDVAARLGISQPYYTRVETGGRKPSLDWLHEAARAIGCDPAELDPRLASDR